MEQKKTINKKLIAIIAGIATIVCIAVAVSVIVIGGNSEKKLAEQLDLAERYMEELDYEAAIAAYEAAIEINPKCEDAYLGLAEAYVAMCEYEDAIKVLEDGYEETESRAIRRALREVEELLEENDGYGKESISSSNNLTNDESEHDEVHEESLVEEQEHLQDENIVDVIDAYCDVVVDHFGNSCCFHIPQINLGEVSTEEVNTQIYNQLYEILQEDVYSIYGTELSHMYYSWGRKDNLVSIIVETDEVDWYWPYYYTYSISTETGEMVSQEDILDVYGMDESEFYDFVREVLQIYEDNRLSSVDISGWEDEYYASVNRTLSDENVRMAVPYINSAGELAIVVPIYIMAGPEMLWYLLDSEGEIEFQECSVDHSGNIYSSATTEELTHVIISQQELYGEWVVDSDYTTDYNAVSLSTLFGSAFSTYGSGMVFQKNGDFSYYIGIGNG